MHEMLTNQILLFHFETTLASVFKTMPIKQTVNYEYYCYIDPSLTFLEGGRWLDRLVALMQRHPAHEYHTQDVFTGVLCLAGMFEFLKFMGWESRCVHLQLPW